MSKRILDDNSNPNPPKRQVTLNQVIQVAQETNMQMSDLPKDMMKKLHSIELPSEILAYIIFLIHRGDIVEFLTYAHKIATTNRQFAVFYKEIVDRLFTQEEQLLDIIESESSSCDLSEMKPKKTIREKRPSKNQQESCLNTNITNDVIAFLLLGHPDSMGAVSRFQSKDIDYLRSQMKKELYFFLSEPVSKEQVKQKFEKNLSTYQKLFSRETREDIASKEFLVEIDTENGKDIQSIQLRNISDLNTLKNIVMYPCGCIPIDMVWHIQELDESFLLETKFISRKGYFTIGNIMDKIIDYFYEPQSPQTMLSFFDRLNYIRKTVNLTAGSVTNPLETKKQWVELMEEFSKTRSFGAKKSSVYLKANRIEMFFELENE